jgi:hypothetical protein
MALTLKKSVVLLVATKDVPRAWPNLRRLSPLIYSKCVNAETPVVGGEKYSMVRRTLA